MNGAREDTQTNFYRLRIHYTCLKEWRYNLSLNSITGPTKQHSELMRRALGGVHRLPDM